MKILVTGGMGFIGSHLCDYLLYDGHEVTVIDDLSTGQKENLAHVEGHPNLTCYIDTIRHKSLLEKVLEQVDIVFHLAAVVGVKAVLKAPLRCLETNIRGTDMLLELALKTKTKVMLASSSEVYGKNQKGKIREEDDRLLGPTTVTRWIYSTTKAVDECLALSYWKEKKLPVVVMRFFNIVGPRQTERYGMVLPTFILQALEESPITVFGDGKQVRTFTYVNDAVRAITSLAKHDNAVGQIFNVGTQEVISIGELAEKVKVITNSKSPIIYLPYKMAYGDGFEDTHQRVPDISKLRTEVGFNPQIGLDDMIYNIVDYYRSQKMTTRAVAALSPPHTLAVSFERIPVYRGQFLFTRED